MAGRSRTLNFVMAGDDRPLRRTFDRVDKRAAQSGKHIGGVHGKIGSSWGSMAKRAAVGAAGMAGAYLTISKAKAAISATETLAKTTLGLSRNLGLTTEQASRWAAVATARGVDGKALTMSFTALSRASGAAREGSEKQADAFHRLGIDVDELRRKKGDFNGTLLAVADGFGKLKGSQDRQRTAQALLGRGYQTLLPLFSQGAKGLEEQMKKADELGVTLNDKTIGPLKELIATERDMKIASLGLKVGFTSLVAPALLDVEQAALKVIKVMRDPDLTGEQKWDKIGQIVEPIAKGMQEGVRKALPRIADTVGEQAPQVAGAFVDGFFRAGPMGRLVIGAWLLKKMGGLGAFAALGRTTGAAYGTNFAVTAGATSAAGGGGRAGAAGGAAAGAALGAGAGRAGGRAILGRAGPIGAAVVGAELVVPVVGQLARKNLPGDIGKVTASIVEFTTVSRKLSVLKGVGNNVADLGEKIPVLGRALRSAKVQSAGLSDSARALSKDFARAAAGAAKFENAADQRNTLKRLHGEVRTLQTRLKGLDKGSEEYRDTSERLRKKQMELRAALRGVKPAGEAAARGLRTVGKSAKDTGVQTDEAAAKIVAQTNQVLSEFGAKPLKYVSVGIANVAVEKAAGGYIGMPGERGRDKVHTILGRGEAVLNRHQQVPVEMALRTLWGIGLGDLFKREQTPHYMAKGGVTGKGEVNLMGADRDLAGYARIGQRYGLSVGSGLRPGSITSSGNLSLHSSGDAIDISGGAGGMLSFARFMARKFGARLEELIHTPLGFGIKNGRRVAPYAQKDHYDHVHVADTSASGVGAAIASIGGVKIAGPAGPLKDMLQGSARRMTKGANAYLDSDAVLGFAGGGIVGGHELNRLAVQAGFKPGREARLAAAIALAESSGNPNARGDGGASHGLWQIYTRAHPWARSLNLFNPSTNARAAYRVFRGVGGSFTPWTMFKNGGYKPHLDEAGPGRSTSRSSGAPAAPKPPKDPLTGPTALGYENQLADIDLAIADPANPLTGDARAPATGTRGGVVTTRPSDVALLRDKKRMQNARIKRVVKRLAAIDSRLAKKIPKSERKKLLEERARLTGELSSLYGEYEGTKTSITDLLAPPMPGEDAAAWDPINRDVSVAGLSPELDDDIAAALAGMNEGQIEYARAIWSGDPKRITAAADNYKQWGDKYDALREEQKQATEANTDALQSHTDALKVVGDELKRQNDFNDRVTGVTGVDAVRFMVDSINGQVMGRQYEGRRHTAGAGSVFRA